MQPDQSTPASERPTQTQYPRQAVKRTALALIGFVLAVAPAMPQIVDAFGLSATVPWVASALALALGITRVLAIPRVNDWLTERGFGAAPRRKS